MKFTNVKKSGTVVLDAVSKEGKVVRLGYGDIIDSETLNKEQYEKSIENGAIKTWLTAGWLVEGEKKIKITGSPQVMAVTDSAPEKTPPTAKVNGEDVVVSQPETPAAPSVKTEVNAEGVQVEVKKDETSAPEIKAKETPVEGAEKTEEKTPVEGSETTSDTSTPAGDEGGDNDGFEDENEDDDIGL